MSPLLVLPFRHASDRIGLGLKRSDMRGMSISYHLANRLGLPVKSSVH